MLKRLVLTPLVLLLLTMTTAASLAQDQGPATPSDPETRPEALAEDGIEKLMQALRGLIERIPRYAMPEITPEGDIIIRRRDDAVEPPVPGAPSDTENPSGPVEL